MASREFLTQAYLAYFGRPVDFGGLQYWATKSEDEIIAGFSASNESKALYGAEFGVQQINAIYNTLFGRDAEPAGLTYWLNQVYSGALAPLEVALGIMAGAAGDDKVAVENKLAASELFTDGLDTTAEILAYNGTAASQAARDFLSGVTSAPATQDAVDAALLALVNGSGTTTGSNISLTVGQDIVAGTSSVDVFKANVVQNDGGYQVNTLGSGDEIDGGAGVDTLNAKITSGVFAGGSYSMPIQPEIKNVENINLQAVIADINGSDSNDQVYVNAKDIRDLDNISSDRSNADLIIMDATTKLSKGGNGNTADITVGMRYTGAADSHWDESDLSVYFEQNDLLRSQNSSDTLELRIANPYELARQDKPLQGFLEVKFSVGATLVTVDISAAQTYAEVRDLINAELAALNITTVTASLMDLRNVVFSDDIDGYVIGQIAGQYNPILLTSTAEELVRGPVTYDSNQTNSNVMNTWVDNPAQLQDVPVTIGVELEKVGLGGDGGALVIGSMNKTASNAWGAVNETTDGVSGFEKFNVKVVGNHNQSSSLASLHSTNNNLREVVVTSDDRATGTFANLQIGNVNTGGDGLHENALKDVRNFDASAFKGNLTLTAGLTTEVLAKYLNRVDAAPAAHLLDDVRFTYQGGLGNDAIDLEVAADNAEFAGTGTYADFSLNVNGGAGNDDLLLHFDDVSHVSGGIATTPTAAAGDVTSATVDNWFVNMVINGGISAQTGTNANANFAAQGGAGNDVIALEGAGAWNVQGNAGADTVYADNSGAMAAWVFNAQPGETDHNDLLSDTIDAYTLANAGAGGGYYKMAIAVTATRADGSAYTTAVPVTIPVRANGAFNDHDINNAIKAAINNDPVLSQLLFAKEGVAGTLVVDSLIDGKWATTGNGLVVEMVAPENLTASDAAAYNAANGTTLDATTLEGTLATLATAWNTAHATADDGSEDYAAQYQSATTTTAFDGEISTDLSQNIISGGAGNDVIALGTGAFSTEVLRFDQAVALNANGNDTVVNFVAAGAGNTADFLVGADGLINLGNFAGADLLDFSFYDLEGFAIDGVSQHADLYGTLTATDIASLVAGDDYIDLVFNATTGAYDIEYNLVTATGLETTIIGTIDFGQNFGADLVGAQIII